LSEKFWPKINDMYNAHILRCPTCGPFSWYRSQIS